MCINLNIATSADYVGIYMKTAVKELLKLGLFKCVAAILTKRP